MKAIIVALIVLCGCSLRNVNRATLAISTASLVCDAGQTIRAATDGRPGPWETNPMLGGSPEVETIVGYFAVAATFNYIAWLAMPERAKSVIPVAVGAAQIRTIHENYTASETGMCGLRM